MAVILWWSFVFFVDYTFWEFVYGLSFFISILALVIILTWSVIREIQLFPNKVVFKTDWVFFSQNKERNLSEFQSIEVIRSYDSERRVKEQFVPYLVHHTKSYKNNIKLIEDGYFTHSDEALSFSRKLGQRLNFPVTEEISK
ncbi:MAG: hypothetical protein KDD61_06215 [Bdellovibrionales bacterium]|nr:hypothetical protein [Bdellovibrionales bacterium]